MSKPIKYFRPAGWRLAPIGLVVLLTFVVSSVPALGQNLMLDSVVVARAQRGVDLAYNMQFDAAARIFDRFETEYPGHPIGLFMHSLTQWWAILPDLGDESLDDEFHRSMQQVAQRCDRILSRNKNSFDAVLFKALANGFRSRLYANRSSWIRAFRYGRRAVEMVERAIELAPENNDYYFGWGMYDYFADVLPERYPYLRPAMWVLPSGNRERGLAEIRRTYERGSFMRAEAAYYLFQIHYVYEPSYQLSRDYIGWLRQRYPDNSFYHVLEARVFNYWGRQARARELFAEIITRYLRRQTGYTESIAEQAYYYLGAMQMLSGEYEEARTNLYQVRMLENRGRDKSRYAVLGRLRLAMVYDVLGDRSTAEQLYREVLSMENVSESKDRAKQYLDTPFKGRIP